MPFVSWVVELRKCQIRNFRRIILSFLTQLIKFVFNKLIGVKTNLVQFTHLRKTIRAFGERTQETGEEVKQKFPRTIL